MNKTLVAMSGGVDSSVAVCLILAQRQQVSGATMRLFCDGPDTDAYDAASVCQMLGIEHFIFDFSDIFKRKVIDGFISSYMSGETPNPCIDCNRHLKFGAFLNRADELGFRNISSGHYAVVEYNPSERRYLLKKAIDLSKDQSYVLYSLTQTQLSRLYLPLGGYTKNEVREIAAESGLENSQKPDSQDICFIRNGSYRDFIGAHLGTFERGGDFLDTSGKIIGRHKGIENYTIGQRKGIGIAYCSPLYVCKKDFASNSVILGGEEDLYAKTFTTRDVNLIAADRLNTSIKAMVRIRYNGSESPGVLHQTSDSEVTVEFDQPQRAVSPGQAAVFYDGDVVIGGGTIC